MLDQLISFLLTGALLCWYWQHTRQAKPIVTVCRCGDMVQHIPGWPTRCPSCKGLIL
jgi:hypothetical protein